MTPAQRKEMLQRVNFERAKANLGLDPLCYVQKLNAAAQLHSEDQLLQKKATHTGTTEATKTFTLRVNLRNYGRLNKLGKRNWSGGENAAGGAKWVKGVVRNWMNSPDHKSNILNKNYTELGVGMAGLFWTQVFGNPQGAPYCVPEM